VLPLRSKNGTTFPLRLWDRQAIGDAQTLEFSLEDFTGFNLTEGALRVTLVWTDPPGDLAAQQQLVNDLDLTLTVKGQPEVSQPASRTYFPNSLGQADRLNTVESIVISPRLATSWSDYTITVQGYRVVCTPPSSGSNCTQPFALVVAQSPVARPPRPCASATCRDISAWNFPEQVGEMESAAAGSEGSVGGGFDVFDQTLFPCKAHSTCGACASQPRCSWCQGAGEAQLHTAARCLPDADANRSCASPLQLAKESQQCPLTLTCSPSVSVAVAVGGVNATVTWDHPISSIAALTAVQTAGPERGSIAQAGTHLVSYAIRAYNPTAYPLATCSFTVCVKDTTPPKIRCPPGRTLVSRGASVKLSLDPPVVTDNIGATWEQTMGPQHNSHILPGDYCVTYVATDAAGGTASCSQLISAVSPLGPARVVCPCNLVVVAGHGEGAVNVKYPDATTTQPGLKVWRSRGLASDAPFPVGVHTVAWQSPGSLCTFSVTVHDISPPTIVCPPDQTVEAPNAKGAVVTFALPNATDDNTGFTVTQTAGQPSGSVYDLGVTINVFVVTDVGGNRAKCSFQVSVVDSIPPSVTCPLDVTAVLTPANRTLVLVAPIAKNSRRPVTVTTFKGPDATAFAFPHGVTEMVLGVQDQVRNMAICRYTVTIEDQVKPVLVCPVAIEVMLRPGEVSTPIQYRLTATDQSEVTLQIKGIQNGQPAPLGPNTIIARAVDTAGNTAECSFTVTVISPDALVFSEEDVLLLQQGLTEYFKGAKGTAREPEEGTGAEEVPVIPDKDPASAASELLRLLGLAAAPAGLGVGLIK
jgi:hypothetical protein